mmetsp:Transcript_33458/g.74021  ORF Transcript_33458/g.74021 Transcript_33458/m.74021 type:complete len:83 (+) Transcript_33458:812-1060(+)
MCLLPRCGGSITISTPEREKSVAVAVAVAHWQGTAQQGQSRVLLVARVVCSYSRGLVLRAIMQDPSGDAHVMQCYRGFPAAQ